MSDFPSKHNSQFSICFVSEKKNQLTNMQVRIHQVRYSLRIQSKNSLRIASLAFRKQQMVSNSSFT